jgi:hypothetical protein
MIWLFLLIPVAAIGLLYGFFRDKVAWFEPLVLIAACILTILISKWTIETSMTSDAEYFQAYVTKVEYYEAWDEYIHQTCTRTCCCDSKGENCSTETYDCSYVDHHPEYWLITTNTSKTFTCSRSEYNRLVAKFGVRPSFVDLHRDYHSYDGDKYVAQFPGDFKKLEYKVWKHKYENRVQASHTILKNEPLTEEQIKKYDIKEYPNILSNNKAYSILGEKNSLDEYVNKKNALIGSKKQVKVFYLVFKDQPQLAGIKQETHWMRGNKNEVNVCIGIDSKTREIQWCYVFGWSEEKIVNIDIESYVEDQKKLDKATFKSIVDRSFNTISNKFKRKEFADFSYLRVEPSFSAKMWVLGIIIFVTLGVCLWIVLNDVSDHDFSSDSSYRNRNYFNRRYRRW